MPAAIAKFREFTSPLFKQRGFSHLFFIAVFAIWLAVGLARSPSSETVIISHAGFEPPYLRIKTGTTVVFQNQDETPHWPASNSHPTHTLYPEGGGCIGSLLDACRPLAPGESFAFTFKQAGQWPMHDHLHPGLVMVVEVVSALDLRSASAPPAERQPPEVFRTLDYASQLSIIETLAARDPKSAWSYLSAALLVNGEAVGYPHEFSHIIGNQLYNKYGIEGIAVCDESFAFGCFHGVTEEYLHLAGPEGVTAAEQKCAEIFPQAAGELRQASCLHGIGHGLLSAESRNLHQALVDCDILLADHRQYCYDGVFMEQAQDFTGKLSSTTAWEFCENLAASYQASCSRYLISIVLKSSAGDFPAAGSVCDRTAKADLQRICLQSLGQLAAQTYQGREEAVAAVCRQASSEMRQKWCFSSAAQEITFQKYRGWQTVSENLLKKYEPR